MKPNHHHRPRPRPPRGAATLIVVMLLFFIVSLVAAYAARNLIFEQKTATNQYRATQALEAAEAGLEWALAMLNGSRIDANCTPLVPPDFSQPSFRQRYLNISIDGNYAPRLWADGVTRERPSCVRAAGGWNCSCPSGVSPAPTIPGGGGVNPAFRVCFEAVNPPQPGVVRVVSTGRTAFVDQSCDTPVEGMAGEAAASVSVVVALSSALPVPPSAALTAGRNATLTGTTVALVNTDPSTNGVTTQVGGTLTATSTTFTRHSLPGTPGDRSSIVDLQLGSLTPAELFTSHLRMPLATYKGQPGSVVVDCSADCANRLNNAVRSNPGRIVWVDVGLNLSTSISLGTDGEPAMIVVDGDIALSGTNVDIVGLLYSQRDISITGTNLTVRGAVLAARDFSRSGTNTTIEYNPAHLTQPLLIPPVLTQLHLSSGSLVRVPGSWRDFP